MVFRSAARLLVVAAVALLAAAVLAAYLEMERKVKLAPGRAPAALAPAGMCFVCIGAAFAARVLPYLLWGRRAPGRVVGLVEAADGDGTYPVVRYAVDGAEYEFRSPVASGAAVGDSVTVLHLPDRPGEGWVESWRQVCLVPALFLGAGGLMLGVWASGL